MEYRELYNGVKIPMLGFGVYQIPEYTQAKNTVLTALKTGYRLIDTAQGYMNEKAVGDAIKESGIPREEIFIATKLWIQDFSYDGAIKATELSMERLGVDYIDLMLLHQPMGDYIGAWRGLEKLYKDGKLKAIGMANCYPHVLADLCETFAIKPMLNQVEMHPFFQQQLNIDTMKEYHVVPEAWAPFHEGRHDFFKNPILSRMHGRRVLREHPAIPYHTMSSGRIKVSAAWLIAHGRVHGKKCGQAHVFHKAPLVIVNSGHATARDVMAVAEAVRDGIKKRYSIILQYEVVIL